jgi:hypothetical protein
MSEKATFWPCGPSPVVDELIGDSVLDQTNPAPVQPFYDLLPI